MIIFIGFDDINWVDYKFGYEYIDVFNWDGSDISNIEYLSRIWSKPRYTVREDLQLFYKIEIVEVDEDRNYLKLKILNQQKDFDLKSYKRDLKIEKLINM